MILVANLTPIWENVSWKNVNLLRSAAYYLAPWRPQLGSSDPERDASSPSRILPSVQP